MSEIEKTIQDFGFEDEAEFLKWLQALIFQARKNSLLSKHGKLMMELKRVCQSYLYLDMIML